MESKIRVGVLFGGKSAEHEVSLQSAKNVVEAMDREKYEVVLIGIGKDGRWHASDASPRLTARDGAAAIALNPEGSQVALVPRGERGELVDLEAQRRRKLPELDVVFPVLHGPMGEDGTVQGLLKLVNVPFVGAGVLGSAVGMDKDVMKRLLREAGIPTPEFLVFRRADGRPDAENVTQVLGMPCFVKPANLGSSVGITKAHDAAEFDAAVDTAFAYDRKIIVETAIEGREIECSVLGNDEPIASVPGEILPQHEFYSYEAKYLDESGAGLEIPANLPEDLTREVQRVAVQTYQVLCCEGMARVDCFVQEDGAVLVNEINTIPGFTRISMYPKLWESSGICYTELIDRLIQLALDRHAEEKKLKTSFGNT